MGRHSAPDDPDDDVSQAAAVAVREREAVTEPESHGRHSQPDAPDAPEPVVAEPVVAERPAPVTAPVETAPGHAVLRGAAQNSAADLILVRSHRGVLAMCAVAIVVPFVVEVVVLLVLGTLTGRSVLVWLWAPLVAAGVLLGLALDLAHRRHADDLSPS